MTARALAGSCFSMQSHLPYALTIRSCRALVSHIVILLRFLFGHRLPVDCGMLRPCKSLDCFFEDFIFALRMRPRTRIFRWHGLSSRGKRLSLLSSLVM